MTLCELFDYDLWANRHWVAYLEAQNAPELERSIFTHILQAQGIWLARIQGEAPTSMPNFGLDLTKAEELNQAWKKVLTTRDLTEIIPYRRLNGDAHEATIGSIAHHVANHGTYHRGELRGLCRAAGREDFPETDLMRFELEPR